MKRKVTYRPSKAQGAFSMVVGIIFVLIGIVAVVPSAGPFGVLWTLIAAGITIVNGYQTFGKGYVGPQIEIEEGEEETKGEKRARSDAKQRLEQLESLRSAGLISDQEYRQKRQEILKDL